MGRLRCQGPWLPEGFLVSASAWQWLPAMLSELQTHLPASAAKQEAASPSISLRASGPPYQARAGQPGVGKAPTASGRGRVGTKGSGTDPREGKGRHCVCVGGEEHRLLSKREKNVYIYLLINNIYLLYSIYINT